jgi:hypothetical protein
MREVPKTGFGTNGTAKKMPQGVTLHPNRHLSTNTYSFTGDVHLRSHQGHKKDSIELQLLSGLLAVFFGCSFIILFRLDDLKDHLTDL